MKNLFFDINVSIEGTKDIHASLTLPDIEGVYPAVLFIAGSGPIDRNGNGPNGKFQFNIYKEMAHYFTELGFATLRYDKRGTGLTEGDYLSTGFWDFVSDAESCILYLKKHPNIDSKKIIIFGHSEGTIIGTALTEKHELGGLMLISGGVDNLEEALFFQRTMAYKELKESKGLKGKIMRKLMDEEKEEKKVKKMMEKMFRKNQDVVRVQLFFKQPAKWFREHFAYQTRESLKQVVCPVIAVHGDKDPLVNSDVLSELNDLVKGKSEYHIIKNMEHGLRVQTEEKSILNAKKMYSVLPSRPINPEFLDTVSKWLVENYRKGDFIDK